MMKPARRSVSRTHLSRASTALLIAALVALGGCERTTPTEDQREAIEAALRDYLPRLALAYAERDPRPLEGYAVTKEIASVQKLVDELGDRGERMVVELQNVTIEELTVWRSTAHVTTLEVWNLERRSLGTDVVLQSYEGQRNRVYYQMVFEDGAWLVMFRVVRDHGVES